MIQYATAADAAPLCGGVVDVNVEAAGGAYFRQPNFRQRKFRLVPLEDNLQSTLRLRIPSSMGSGVEGIWTNASDTAMERRGSLVPVARRRVEVRVLQDICWECGSTAKDSIEGFPCPRTITYILHTVRMRLYPPCDIVVQCRSW